MARLTQRERRAAVAGLTLLLAGEWACDFEPDKPDPFDADDIESATEKISAGLKSE